jgi:hypothetical protein
MMYVYTYMDETIWYRDLAAFFRSTRLWAPKNASATLVLNVVFRFSLYYALIVFALTGHSWPLTIAVLVGVATYAMHVYLETLSDKPIVGTRRPTLHNPAMNTLPFDDVSKWDVPPANVLEGSVRDAMNDTYHTGVPHDNVDIFGRNTGARAFYTVPRDDVAGGFARHLFRFPKEVSWKERGVLFHK